MKEIEALLWTKTRTRSGGRQKTGWQSAARSGSGWCPIRWSTPLPLMATDGNS